MSGDSLKWWKELPDFLMSMLSKHLTSPAAFLQTVSNYNNKSLCLSAIISWTSYNYYDFLGIMPNHEITTISKDTLYNA